MDPLALTAVGIAAIASPIVAAIVGIGQVAVVWYGIQAMIAVSQVRAHPMWKIHGHSVGQVLGEHGLGWCCHGALRIVTGRRHRSR